MHAHPRDYGEKGDALDPLIDQLPRSPFHAIKRYLAISLPFWFVSSLIVVLGAVFGQSYITLPNYRTAKATEALAGFAAWDGEHYVRIAQEGYSYDPKAQSNVAFFPAYPLAGRFIAAVTGWGMELSLIVVAYSFLIAAFAAATLYVKSRVVSLQPMSPNVDIPLGTAAPHYVKPSADDRATIRFVLLALGFFPTTFYFRMTYSESLFLFEVIVILYGLQNRWRFWALAVMIGLATATRASGVALLMPFIWYIWDRSATWRDFVLDNVFMVPLACWGLAAYMIFLYLAFGDPLAFAKTQKHWDQRPPIPLADKLLLEAVLEPIACEYDPSCACHALHSDRDPSPLFSMYFANPIYFLLFAGFLGLGAVKGWLNEMEVLAGAALLLFSYFSKSYATCMCSQARYASTVFPAYLVMGRLLQCLPGPFAALILGLCGFFLGIYSALFVSWYAFY